VTVTCILSHELGHSEDGNSLTAPPDCSGNKNGVQGIASTSTFLERYTLKASLGLATTDDDGRAAGDPIAGQDATAGAPQVALLTPEQIEDLRTRIVHAGLPLANFFTWAKVKRVEDIRADRYDRCVQAIIAWGERSTK